MNERPASQSLTAIDTADRAVDLIFEASYAPARVANLLNSAETRSRIRKLAPTQLFFGLLGLDDQQMQRLLPHVTEEQWTAILDLSLWDRDQADIERLLSWQRHLCDAPDPVARKLWRATSPLLWELAFAQDLRIFRRLDEDSYEEGFQEEAAILKTPDDAYLIQLPEDPIKAEIWQTLIPKLYHLEPEQMALLLEEALFRTPIELEEEAYQERCRHLADMGLQDYFEAITIYSPLPLTADLPLKNRKPETPLTTLPDNLNPPSGLLLLQALAGIQDHHLLQQIPEELFFVCNKLISADRVQPDHPEQLREAIRKCLAGLNLGLSLRSRDNVLSAIAALRDYFLLNLFQIGFGRLLELQTRARELLSQGLREDLFEQATLEALAEPYPKLTDLQEGRVVVNYFWSRHDLDLAHSRLDRMSTAG